MEKLEAVINNRGIDIHYNTNEIQHEIMNSPITQTELYHAIRKSKVGKACGSDAIPAEFYKHEEEMLHKAILALFHCVFHNGAYPQIWSEGIINPIFKRGKMTIPWELQKNYAPVVAWQAIWFHVEQSLVFLLGGTPKWKPMAKWVQTRRTVYWQLVYTQQCCRKISGPETSCIHVFRRF